MPIRDIIVRYIYILHEKENYWDLRVTKFPGLLKENKMAEVKSFGSEKEAWS